MVIYCIAHDLGEINLDEDQIDETRRHMDPFPDEGVGELARGRLARDTLSQKILQMERFNLY